MTSDLRLYAATQPCPSQHGLDAWVNRTGRASIPPGRLGCLLAFLLKPLTLTCPPVFYQAAVVASSSSLHQKKRPRGCDA